MKTVPVDLIFFTAEDREQGRMVSATSADARPPHGRLVATWPPGQFPGDDLPAEIRWSNGDRASVDDYLAHLGDTNFDVRLQDGSTERVYVPGLVADVIFDRAAGTWVLQGCWRTTSLQLPDPNVGDFTIQVMAWALPVRFRLQIHRENTNPPFHEEAPDRRRKAGAQQG